MGNLKIDPINDNLLKNEPIVNKGIKILHNHQGTRLLDQQELLQE